jgi:hypothetical protein
LCFCFNAKKLQNLKHTRAQGLEHICNTSFGDPRPAEWVKIPPEIKWETPMAAQVIAAAHGDIKG